MVGTYIGYVSCRIACWWQWWRRERAWGPCIYRRDDRRSYRHNVRRRRRAMEDVWRCRWYPSDPIWNARKTHMMLFQDRKKERDWKTTTATATNNKNKKTIILRLLRRMFQASSLLVPLFLKRIREQTLPANREKRVNPTFLSALLDGVFLQLGHEESIQIVQMRIVSSTVFHERMKCCAFETRHKRLISGKINLVRCVLGETFDTEFQTCFDKFHRSIVQRILNDGFVLFHLVRRRSLVQWRRSSLHRSYEDRASRIDDVSTGGRTFVHWINGIEKQLTLGSETPLDIFLVLERRATRLIRTRSFRSTYFGTFHRWILGDHTGTTARCIDQTSIEATHVLITKKTSYLPKDSLDENSPRRNDVRPDWSRWYWLNLIDGYWRWWREHDLYSRHSRLRCHYCASMHLRKTSNALVSNLCDSPLLTNIGCFATWSCTHVQDSFVRLRSESHDRQKTGSTLQHVVSTEILGCGT